MTQLPARYEAIERLGQGGGGEVWSVRDRVDGRLLALKALPVGLAGGAEAEIAALVREATALLDLSASTGMSLPRVVRFGRLENGLPYLLRELVVGESLAAFIERRGPLLVGAKALLAASAQLTQLHRAGLLHGDVKPANVIVQPDGGATLVDLGLATVWGPTGARVEGLTPRYAAPELFEGEPLTVRGEVYAVGVTLRDVLAAGDPTGVTPEAIQTLTALERRSTQRDPLARPPSVDELGATIAQACGLALPDHRAHGIWTIVGTEVPLGGLLRAVDALEAGGALDVVGPAGAGGRTLLAALAWRLGIEGQPVAWIAGQATEQVLALELATALGKSSATDEAFGARRGLLIIDDPGPLESRLAALRACGARVVSRRIAAADDATVFTGARITSARFEIPRIGEREAISLVSHALPSLPDAVVARIVARGEGRPGRLRAIVDAVGARAIVRAESVDVIVVHLDVENPSSQRVSGTAEIRKELNALDRVRELLDGGRLTEAEDALASAPKGVEADLLRAAIALTKGELEVVRAVLDGIDLQNQSATTIGTRLMLGAKLASRHGDYDGAVELATRSLEIEGIATVAPPVAAEALQARGVAQIYRGQDVKALEDLARAHDLALSGQSRRVEAMVHISFALAHQRAGRPTDARQSYARAITAAEAAGDAAAVANARVNAGTLAWAEGDMAAAIAESEAAADLARRVGRMSTLERALVNLAIVDLHLGRYARVASTLTSLEAMGPQMTAVGRAQMLGLRADLAARTDDLEGSRTLYRATIEAWRGINRPQDAAEAAIDEVLVRRQRSSQSLGQSAEDARADLTALDEAERDLGARAGELKAAVALARGLSKQALADDAGALQELDRAIKDAAELGASELRWQAHAARARLLSSVGSVARARRDFDEAAAILEEMAGKLPRDLREVFWDEPRRKAVRQVHESTILSARGSMPPTNELGRPTKSAVAPTAPATPGVGATQFVRLAEDRLARILAVNRDLACEPDLERLLSRVTDQAIDLLGADRGFVLLSGRNRGIDAEPDSKDLEARAMRDRRKDEPSLSFSRSIAERVLETSEPIVTNNARGDARIAGSASIHALSIHAVACVPIPRVRGSDRSPIGVLYLETRSARARTRDMEAELPTLLAFADQVGIAIANAQLVEENVKRAEQLAAMNRELQVAHEKLDEALARRTEQLERAKADLAGARQALRGHTGYAGFKGLVGTSASMRKLYALLDRVRVADVPLLITGESGTGKEVIARAIHSGGERSRGPFLGVNCGAIPENLLESELFGHVRGAFTGADRERKGLFREAEGGTILLDEIGEMPLKMQAGLLRVLQERKVRPVGGQREENVDARVIFATHRDLQEMVSQGKFREDLYYRINVVALELPALRERLDDVPLLSDHFLGVFAAHYRRDRKVLSREAMRRLSAYTWPGNVRQLEHVLLNAFVLTDGDIIGADDLTIPDGRASSSPVARVPEDQRRSGTSEQVRPEPKNPVKRPDAGTNTPESRRVTADWDADSDTERDHIDDELRPAGSLEEHKSVEKDRILAALERAGWNRLQAAQLCGIPRRTFYRRLKEYGIQT